MVPEAWNWSVGDVEDDDALLRALRARELGWFTATFGVRRGWLEGDGRAVYEWPLGYKQPQVFARTLDELGWVNQQLRMRVLSAGYKTKSDVPLGSFTLVFSYPIAEWDHGEKVVYRHLNLCTGLMDWSHPPCARDAIVLTRWYHERAVRYGRVPIVPCSLKNVEGVADRTAFPGLLVPWGCGGFDQFQDRVLEYRTPQGLRVPLPVEGLGDAVRYGRDVGLLAPMSVVGC